MASHITPAFSETQHSALRANERAPLVYVNVAVRNWRPWQRLGIHDVYGVDTFFSRYKLDYPVSFGKHGTSADPSQPILLHLVHVPYTSVTKDVRSAIRTARRTLLQRTFADFERMIRNELEALLKPGGFDFDRDVFGITVNRWPHGYSWQQNTLADPDDQSARLLEEARQPLGAIAVAGADAGWSQYLNGAIDEAFRAVNELPAR
jgi:spermidine dehydrogenase